MASEEYFTQDLKPELWSSLSSIIEELRVSHQATKGYSARSHHNDRLAQTVQENFVQLCKNQDHCLRSGKMVEDSPELTYTEGSSRSPLAADSCGCNCTSMS